MTPRDEYILERAAIMEYDAGLPRAEAERRAAMEWSAYIERIGRANIAECRRNHAALVASRKGWMR